jgi:S-formylglutathione hydrolase
MPNLASLVALIAIISVVAPETPAHDASATRVRRESPLVPALDSARGATCTGDFDQMAALLRTDYAGYTDKVRGRGEALDSLTRTIAAAAALTTDPTSCNALMIRWLTFFHDKHLGLESGGPPRSLAERVTGAPATSPELRPSLAFLNDSTAFLRVPTFELGYKPLIDSVIASARTQLAATPKLLIDIRGNGGGGDASYDEILPLLATGPIHVVGADVLATPDNIAYYRAALDISALPAATWALVRAAVARMTQHPGRFVALDDDTTITFARIYPGIRRVGILIDDQVGSSAEQFLLAARQSRKVLLFGRTRSAGADDYANVRPVTLPSGTRVVRIPTSRTRRTGAARVDPNGIAPDVLIPRDASDAVAYVRGLLTGGVAKPLGALSGRDAPPAPSPIRPHRMVYEPISSRFGRMNALGDSAVRTLAVYLPPDYDLEPTRRFPVLYLLQSGRMSNFAWMDGTFRDAAAPNDSARGLHVQVAMDTLIRQGKVPEMIVVMPDGSDALGASWYANSPASGFWEDYLLREIVPHVDSAYRTIPNRASRGIAGHSLGGFGAMRLAMRHPDVFGAVYAMSPCCLAWEGELGFTSPVWRQVLSVTSPAKADTLSAAPWALYTAALAFSPDTARHPLLVDWPVQVSDGNVSPVSPAAASWLAASPVATVGRYAPALRTLRGIGAEAGDQDQFPHIPRTVREFADSLERLGIPHTYTTFKGGHEDQLPERVTGVMLPFMGRVLVH